MPVVREELQGPDGEQRPRPRAANSEASVGGSGRDPVLPQTFDL